YFRFDDKLRIREIDREANVRRSDRPSKKEKSSTKCRHQNYDAIRLHISVRDSTICARRFRGGARDERLKNGAKSAGGAHTPSFITAERFIELWQRTCFVSAMGNRYPKPPVFLPVMWQRWHEICFFHWSCDPSLLQTRLPTSLHLDTFEAK